MLKRLKNKLYFCKQWLSSVFVYPHTFGGVSHKGVGVYPKMGERDEKYQKYWEERGAESGRPLNSFQRKRAEMTAERIEPDSTVMDIGCGNGGTLLYLSLHKPLKKMIGVDFSPKVLSMAQKAGIDTVAADISKSEILAKLPPTDYILLFEVLEHLPNSEELLQWAIGHAYKGVFFSVPNTGFFAHRLRLLLGRFPLQWRVHPSEHLRFWTVRDMKWWLRQLGYRNYVMRLYEGVPILNCLWPSLFAQGIWVCLARSSRFAQGLLTTYTNHNNIFSRGGHSE